MKIIIATLKEDIEQLFDLIPESELEVRPEIRETENGFECDCPDGIGGIHRHATMKIIER